MFISALEILATVLSLMQEFTGRVWHQNRHSQTLLGNGKDLVPVFRLDEGTLLVIFSFLSVKDLLRSSRVCRWWYRVSFDSLLWKRADLRNHARNLADPAKLNALIFKRFGFNLIWIDLSGFTLTETSLKILANQCTELRVLKLKSITFTVEGCRIEDLSGPQDVGPRFPHVRCLDIRFSHGSFRVYRAFASNLSKVTWLGLSSTFFQALYAERKLESTIDSLINLRQLDLSHSLSLKDSTLALFARCRTLEVLIVRKSPMLRGGSLQYFLDSCCSLKTLILDGIGMDDDTLNKLVWNKTSLKHLELAWCPLITTVGLTATLPSIAKIPTLEVLALSAIGDGKAMNDEVLTMLAVSLSRERSTKVKSIDLTSSRYITRRGLQGFRNLCPFVEVLDTTNCPRINSSIQKWDQNNNVAELESARKRKGSKSAILFASFKYAPETPL